MEKKGKKVNLMLPTLIMGLIALVMFLYISFYGEKGDNTAGLLDAAKLLVRILPLMFFAFVIAELTVKLLPPGLLEQWVGTKSGLRGIFIGSVAGALTPGGPYVSLPVVAGLLNSGAKAGTMVAFLTAWSLASVARLPLELSIVGPRFTLVKIASTILFPPLAGIIADFIVRFYRI